MEKITIWSVIDKNENKKHNHIEDGWSYEDYPKQIKKEFFNQMAWENMNWNWEHGYLIDGKVVRA